MQRLVATFYNALVNCVSLVEPHRYRSALHMLLTTSSTAHVILVSRVKQHPMTLRAISAEACSTITDYSTGHDRPTFFATIYRVEVIARTEPRRRRSAGAQDSADRRAQA